MDLWSQFAADARASLRFLWRRCRLGRNQKLPRWHRPLHVAKEFFLGADSETHPARRVLFPRFGSDVDFSAVQSNLKLESAAAVRLSSPAFPLELGRQSHHEARPGNRARNSKLAGAIVSAGDTRRGSGIRLAAAKFRGRRLLRRVFRDHAGYGWRKTHARNRRRGRQKHSGGAADGHAASQPAHHRGEGASLADLVIRLNRYACAHSLDGRRFTTAVLAEYEPAARRLSYVNAGHNAPILRRANGDMEKAGHWRCALGIHSAPEVRDFLKRFAAGRRTDFFHRWRCRSVRRKWPLNLATSVGWRRFARYRKLRLRSRCNF